MLSLGIILWAIYSSFISVKYLRRLTTIVSKVRLFIIGSLLYVTAQVLKVLIIGNIILGIGVWLISAVVPLYQMEMAGRTKGMLLSFYINGVLLFNCYCLMV